MVSRPKAPNKRILNKTYTIFFFLMTVYFFLLKFSKIPNKIVFGLLFRCNQDCDKIHELMSGKFLN